MYEIKLDRVRVEFTVYDRRSRSLRDVLLLNPVRKFATVTSMIGGQLNVDQSGNTVVRAMDDVSLKLVDGDRVGLIGHNGAGKTTMLRVMAQIYEPVSGQVTVRGSVMPIFSITEGLDIDATGYETIRLRGLMLGRSAQEVEDTAAEIAEFTELRDYLHMPLRTYSSGMLVRLAFGIATSAKPEILLMDEVIGAGDASFVDRAKARLESFVASSGIMVVATHNLDILRKWCNKALLMGNGRLIADGDVETVIAEHHKMVHGVYPPGWKASPTAVSATAAS